MSGADDNCKRDPSSPGASYMYWQELALWSSVDSPLPAERTSEVRRKKITSHPITLQSSKRYIKRMSMIDLVV